MYRDLHYGYSYQMTVRKRHIEVDMRWFREVSIIVSFLVLVAILGGCEPVYNTTTHQETEPQIVTFVDENLDTVIRDTLGKLPGDIIMATTNFGCGSSREHAPLAIKASGISCIIARSFARIFFRNAINIGLPLLECSQAVDKTETGDILEVDLGSGEIKNLTSGMEFTASPYPDFMAELISAGGLIEHTKKRLSNRRV